MEDSPTRSGETLKKDPRSPGMVEVDVKDGEEARKSLEAAIMAVSGAAQRNNMGIMVTELGPGYYIVRAHPMVPFGLVRRRRQQ